MHLNQALAHSDVLRLARRQLADYDARSPGTLFAGRGTSLEPDNAYRVQLATAKLRCDRGELVAGYKIGCVSETVRRQLGVEHAVFGHVFRSEIRASPAKLRASEFCCLGVEGEFAVTLAQDIDDPEELASEPGCFVGNVQPVIELHNYVFRGPKPSAGEVIANNALQAGIVVPKPQAARNRLGPLPIRVSIGTRVNDCAEVDPCEYLHELALRLAAYRIRPRKGNILLTGSPLPLYLVDPGDPIKVTCDGLAEVSASVDLD